MLNVNFLEKDKVGVRTRFRSKVSPKSGLKKSKIIKTNALKVLLSCIIALLRVKSLSSSLKITK